MDVSADTPSTPSDSPAENIDQIPGGRYHTVDRLSTGAIGAVYKALDTILDRPVAVKCVRLDTPFADQTPDELRERFVREARVAARLQHPNIVTIHDIVATPDRGYIIMEFIQGRTLESLLASEKRLPLSAAIRILSQLAAALDYAHGRNVVHRDVKPSNILVAPSMYSWVTDFGIAKSELSTNLTMAGGVLGAPDYMSPEQAKGEDVDARSDLFSLGCILFECAVGEKPFRSPSLTGVLLSIINDEPVFPLNWRSLGLPNELKPILHHALEKDPERRFESGAALIEALEAIPADAILRADESVSGSSLMSGAATSEAPAEPPKPDAEPVAERDEEAQTEDAAQSSHDSAEEAVEAAPGASTESAASDEPEPAPTEDAEPEETARTDEPEEPEESQEAEASETPEESSETPEESDTSEEPPAAKAAPTAEPSDEFASMLPAPELVAAVSSDEEETKESDEEDASKDVESADSAPSPEASAPPVESEGETRAMPTLEEPEPPPQSDDGVSEESPTEREPASTDTAAEAEAETSEPDGAEDVSPVTDDPTAIDPARIEELKEESQVLHLDADLSTKLQGLSISPEEGFILSRIDGASRPGDVLSVSPMPERDTARALLDLLEKGLIRLGGVASDVKPEGSSTAKSDNKPAAPPAEPQKTQRRSRRGNRKRG